MNTAQLHGASWGASAVDWAEIQQPTMRPAFDAVLHELRPWHAKTLLDIGCGAGAFTALAAGLGARTSGLDPARPLVEIARTRHPAGTFLIGDMQHLPFPDRAFDRVTAFNTLHFADDATTAVNEALRVTRAGGTLTVAAWGPAAECDAVTYLLDLGALMPHTPTNPSTSLNPADLSTLRILLDRNEVTLTPWRVVPCPWHYPDLRTALRGLLSTGPAAQAITHSGRTKVTDTITNTLTSYRNDDGSYTLNNTCHYLTATKT